MLMVLVQSVQALWVASALDCGLRMAWRAITLPCRSDATCSFIAVPCALRRHVQLWYIRTYYQVGPALAISFFGIMQLICLQGFLLELHDMAPAFCKAVT